MKYYDDSGESVDTRDVMAERMKIQRSIRDRKAFAVPSVQGKLAKPNRNPDHLADCSCADCVAANERVERLARIVELSEQSGIEVSLFD